MKSRFLSNTLAEFIKTKRSFALWLTLLAAAFIPAINAVILLERPEMLLAKFEQTPWLTFLRFNWKNVAAVILPMYIILITNLVVQIEFRNNTWKQVYASPRSFADIFFSKLLVVQALVPFYILCFDVFVIISGLLVHWINPAYHLTAAGIDWENLMLISSRIYLGCLAVSIIQYWLSLRFRNFVVPLGLGLGLWISGIILMDWDKSIYYPYVYSAFMFFIDFDKEPEKLVTLVLSSVAAIIASLGIAYYDTSRLPEKG
ncbi:MAG: hypothetical protein BGO21_05200 [Dyadobacter sp. 50-39]|uniref:ABC transporter permease n=1 Tax=Dyadobacter sp. 50-39 TaxID=1895756 RepID=UPI000969D4CF|nr:ABC transporter permease [Dyadobacter sp. 50-39]OJV22555.1 MAG: hypothetical protein BGO21_05200 [Dyadobacter sp. 50-39]